jgi:hypothetical protein
MQLRSLGRERVTRRIVGAGKVRVLWAGVGGGFLKGIVLLVLLVVRNMYLGDLAMNFCLNVWVEVRWL